MHDPQMYSEINHNQARDGIDLLKRYGEKMRWKPNCKVVDLGSGDGSFTATFLPKYLPSDFNSILGIDVSKEMVSHSSRNYSNHKINFTRLDLAGPLPHELQSNFHHAVSFYVLHWMKDQETAFQNIYNMLTEDGNCLLMFVGWNAYYDWHRALSRTEKWGPRLSNIVDKVIVRYQDLEDPEKEVHRIMTEIGFKNVHVEYVDSPFIFDGVASFKKLVQAVNLFRLPADVLEEFSEDMVTQLLLETGQEDKEDQDIILPHKKLIAFGSK